MSTVVANTVSQLVFANTRPALMQGLPLASGSKASQWGSKTSWMLFSQLETYSAEARVILPSLYAPFGLPQPTVALINVTLLLTEQQGMPSGHHFAARAWRQPDVIVGNTTRYCGHLVVVSGAEQSPAMFTASLSGERLFSSDAGAGAAGGNESTPTVLRLFAADYKVDLVNGTFTDWIAPASHNVRSHARTHACSWSEPI